MMDYCKSKATTFSPRCGAVTSGTNSSMLLTFSGDPHSNFNYDMELKKIVHITKSQSTQALLYL